MRKTLTAFERFRKDRGRSRVDRVHGLARHFVGRRRRDHRPRWHLGQRPVDKVNQHVKKTCRAGHVSNTKGLAG